MSQKKLMVFITALVILSVSTFTIFAQNGHSITQTERLAALCKVWGLVTPVQDI